MTNFVAKILTCVILGSCLTGLVIAQEPEIISADTVDRLQPVRQIDYADFDADINIGWFTIDSDASRVIFFDNDNNLYHVSDDGDYYSWSYVDDPENDLFNVIDGVHYRDTIFILYVINDTYFVNEQQLDIEGIPVNISRGRDFGFLYVEATLEDGNTVVYEYGIAPITNELELTDQIPYPLDEIDEPIMRVGRIDLPPVVGAYLEGDTIMLAFGGFPLDTRLYDIENGPAVFGALSYEEYTGYTHFAWVDPNSTYLNLLDFATGENRIVAELDNLYSQYYLLSQDASLVIAVNVDFEPIVVAWDTTTGGRYELGKYRECERIPDKVELSSDGSTLIIGCDSGIELWRIVDETEID